MDWALQAVMKYLELDPEEVKGQLAKTVQIIVNADKRLSKIEADQTAILAALEKAGYHDRAIPVGADNGAGAVIANDSGGPREGGGAAPCGSEGGGGCGGGSGHGTETDIGG